MKKLTFIGFILEMFCFIIAGFAFLYNTIYYFVFALLGLIFAFMVGRMIAQDAVEKYKKEEE